MTAAIKIDTDNSNHDNAVTGEDSGYGIQISTVETNSICQLYKTWNFASGTLEQELISM
jgi:hypothetical protein